MLVTRHASAGEKLAAPLADRARRLDVSGRADARQLPSALAPHPIGRIVSSSHVRCLETVEPIARARGLEVEVREELAPGADRADTLALLGALRDDTLVCTHREVFDTLFAGEITCEKGGTWIVEGGVPVAYLPPLANGQTTRVGAFSGRGGSGREADAFRDSRATEIRASGFRSCATHPPAPVRARRSRP